MKSAYILWLALILIAPARHDAYAAETVDSLASPFTLKGFGTLGIARADTDDPRFVRDLTQPDGLTRDWSGKIDSLLGLQANYLFSPEWEGVLQGISRYRYDGSYHPELSWAFLRYDPNPSVGIRAGRLGTEFYMLADSRQVGYSNLTVRPPTDYFGSVVFSYIDGLDLYATTQLGEGLLRGKLFTGISPEKTAFAENVSWDLSGARLIGGHLDYLTGPWQFRLGHARVRFDKEAPLSSLTSFDILAIEPELSVVDTWTQFNSFGAVYDNGPLQLQLMLSRTEHETASYEDTRAGYLIGSYRIGHVTPYLGYSRTISSQDKLKSPPPEPMASYISQLSAATHTDQHTWFIGARWDIQPNLALKAQIDLTHGEADSVFLYRGNNSLPGWDGRMNVYSLALDFIF
jgi:hypothetical protein